MNIKKKYKTKKESKKRGNNSRILYVQIVDIDLK
jgi:hypothetical protein